MSRGIAIVITILLLLLLIGGIRLCGSMFSKFLGRMSPFLKVLLLVMLVGIVILWINYVSRTFGWYGEVTDKDSGRYEENAEAGAGDIRGEDVEWEDTIVLREDEIWINNRRVSREYAQQYIEQCSREGKVITLIDDYAIAGLFHEVERMCDEKGVIITKR